MSSTSDGSAAAFDAQVRTGGDAGDSRADYRRELVEQLEGEVALMEEKLTGWKESLAAKKAELKEARSAAKRGDE